MLEIDVGRTGDERKKLIQEDDSGGGGRIGGRI